MVSLIASSMLFGQLMLNQPIIQLNTEHQFQPSTSAAESLLIACQWYPLCTDPDKQSTPPKHDTDNNKTSDDQQLA